MTTTRVSNINFTLWDELRDAISKLIADGDFQDLIDIHAAGSMAYRMHGTHAGKIGYQRFLPWHRVYLIQFERALQKINPDLSIPFWDWGADEGNLIGFDTLLGNASRDLGAKTNTMPNWGQDAWFVSPNEVAEVIDDNSDYLGFAKDLELGLHNNGHNWVGGHMVSMASPTDPAFWFHHAQVDRIWHLWQQKNPGKKAQLNGADAKLDPWEADFNISNIDDISNLGTDSYSYA